MPRSSHKDRCHAYLIEALNQGAALLRLAATQRQNGFLQHAVSGLRAAAEAVGEAWGRRQSCEIYDSDGAIQQLRQDIQELEKKLGDDCKHGWKAGLSGVDDPYEAYRKARKPLPPQRSGPMGHKKGKKGYDRKRDKQRQRKEDR